MKNEVTLTPTLFLRTNSRKNRNLIEDATNSSFALYWITLSLMRNFCILAQSEKNRHAISSVCKEFVFFSLFSAVINITCSYLTDIKKCICICFFSQHWFTHILLVRHEGVGKVIILVFRLQNILWREMIDTQKSSS